MRLDLHAFIQQIILFIQSDFESINTKKMSCVVSPLDFCVGFDEHNMSDLSENTMSPVTECLVFEGSAGVCVCECVSLSRREVLDLSARVDRLGSVASGPVSAARVDRLLFLRLERSQIHQQGKRCTQE